MQFELSGSADIAPVASSIFARGKPLSEHHIAVWSVGLPYVIANRCAQRSRVVFYRHGGFRNSRVFCDSCDNGPEVCEDHVLVLIAVMPWVVDERRPAIFVIKVMGSLQSGDDLRDIEALVEGGEDVVLEELKGKFGDYRRLTAKVF